MASVADLWFLHASVGVRLTCDDSEDGNENDQTPLQNATDISSVATPAEVAAAEERLWKASEDHNMLSYGESEPGKTFVYRICPWVCLPRLACYGPVTYTNRRCSLFHTTRSTNS